MAAAALIAGLLAAAAPGPALVVQEVDRPPRAVTAHALSGCLYAAGWESRYGADQTIERICLAQGTLRVTPLADLPSGVEALALDAREGRPALLIGRAGRVDRLPLVSGEPDGSPETWIEDPRLGGFAGGSFEDIDGDGSAELVAAVYSGVLVWRVGRKGTPAFAREVPVAPRGGWNADGVYLAGPSLAEGDRIAGGALWSGPLRERGARLSAWRIPFDRPAEPPCRAWIKTDDPLRPAGRPLVLDRGLGAPPLLISAVLRADRAELFGEYRIVTAPLACDRTARGRPPEQTLDTPFPLYRSAPRLVLADLTGDGTRDLLLAGVVGRTKPKLALRLHEGKGNGRFSKRARRWSRRVPQPERVRFDRDLAPGGRFGLLFVGEGALLLFTVAPDRWPGDEPDLELRLPDGVTVSRFEAATDLDGDGAPEILLSGERAPAGEGERPVPLLLLVDPPPLR